MKKVGNRIYKSHFLLWKCFALEIGTKITVTQGKMLSGWTEMPCTTGDRMMERLASIRENTKAPGGNAAHLQFLRHTEIAWWFCWLPKVGSVSKSSFCPNWIYPTLGTLQTKLILSGGVTISASMYFFLASLLPAFHSLVPSSRPTLNTPDCLGPD